jgi:hypothetical protein
MENIKTPRALVDLLTSQRIAATLGVTVTAVNERARLGKLPAAWFDALELMAGESLPRDLFSFKRGWTE